MNFVAYEKYKLLTIIERVFCTDHIHNSHISLLFYKFFKVFPCKISSNFLSN